MRDFDGMMENQFLDYQQQEQPPRREYNQSAGTACKKGV